MVRYRFSEANPETAWLPSTRDRDRKMQLLKEFGFFNSQGRDWIAPEGQVIDGASIPRPLWSLVGSPYCGLYRRASIVHDWACEQAAGNAAARKKADRMFYEACRAGGCDPFQAMILYLGVRIGAWVSGTALAAESDAPALDLGPGGATVTIFQDIGRDLPAEPPDDAGAVERIVEEASAPHLARYAALAEAFRAAR